VERTPLPQTIAEAFEYADKNLRIVPWAAYGQHVELRCSVHTDKRWTTKNIDSIYARSIFHVCKTGDHCGVGGMTCLHHHNDGDVDCSGELEPVIPEDWMQRIVPLAIWKCVQCDRELKEENRVSLVRKSDLNLPHPAW
jgi:hypothetical protein